MKNKHLTSSDRIEIELGLKQNKSLTDIANVVDKSVGAIRNEIKNHREKKYPSSFNGAVNICSYFKLLWSLSYFIIGISAMNPLSIIRYWQYYIYRRKWYSWLSFKN